MATYALTGKVGGGKSLIAVHKIREAFERGAIVATNLDLNMEHLCGPKHAQTVLRLPDHPTRADLDAIGEGWPTPDEDKFGYLILDEAATFLNSRHWQKDGRELVVEWFRHVRKHGWHLYLIIQDLSALDKQIREAIIEHLVICRRADRMPIPVIGGLIKLIGFTGKLPKVHIAVVKYGLNSQSITVDRWFYRGRHLYDAYDTRQIFDGDVMKAGHKALHTILSVKHAPWIQEPTGMRESIYKVVEAMRKRYSGTVVDALCEMLPAWAVTPSPARRRYNEFSTTARLGLPRYRPAPGSTLTPSFQEWLLDLWLSARQAHNYRDAS